MLRLAGALGTGLLVVLSFPQYGYEVGLDHLIWFALVPLLLAATGAGRRQGFLLGWGAGLVLEGAGFVWILFAIRNFTGLGRVIASLLFGAWLIYSSFAWALLGIALGGCRRPVGVLGVLLFFVGIEHYYPRLFAWHLGGALYGRTVMVQCADLFGASGLTALVFLANVCIYLAIGSLRGRGRFPLAPMTALLLLLGGAWFYGERRLADVELTEKNAPLLNVLMVQRSIDPRLRLLDVDEQLRVLKDYLDTTREWLEAHPEEASKVDLILWPEGADPVAFELTPGSDPWEWHGPAKEALSKLLRPAAPGEPERAMITGGGGRNAQRFPPFSNIAVFIRPGAKPLIYEKNKPLLFGERVPLIDLLPRRLREALDLHIGNIAVGEENPLLHLQSGAGFRNLICYEAVIPGYVQQASRGADFLVNLTEDMWYGNTAQIPQHVSVLILRVVENRTPLVRCANVGPSGVIRISGRFDRGDKVFAPEVIVRTLRAASLRTVYQQFGYLFPLGALIFSLVILVLPRWGERNRITKEVNR